MTKLLWFDWAPLRGLPLERRLQTLAMFVMTSEIVFAGPTVLIFLLYLLTTRLYWLPCLYLAWWCYDRQTCNRGGYSWTPARTWSFWNYYRDYFPVKLVKTADLDPAKNYIFTVHPHGIICFGIMLNFATEATGFSRLFPGLRARLLTLQEQFVMPVHREMLQMTGAASATRPSMDHLLSKSGTGNALILMPGGAVEALDAVPGKFDLTLDSRKGFCRMALKHGADIVPVLSFGENEIFSQVEHSDQSLVRRIQRLITKKFRFAPPLFHGRGIFQYTFGAIPYRKPITTVVGKPIHVDKVDGEPSVEVIGELHARYCKILMAMYDEHKEAYGFKDVPLVIK